MVEGDWIWSECQHQHCQTKPYLPPCSDNWIKQTFLPLLLPALFASFFTWSQQWKPFSLGRWTNFPVPICYYTVVDVGLSIPQVSANPCIASSKIFSWLSCGLFAVALLVRPFLSWRRLVTLGWSLSLNVKFLLCLPASDGWLCCYAWLLLVRSHPF